jgi:hypothetical protein
MAVDLRNVASHVKDVDGNIVGFVESPDRGPLRVKLDEPWHWIEQAINDDIRDGHPLLSPNRTLQSVTAATESDLSLVTQAIRILSERRLRVGD